MNRKINLLCTVLVSAILSGCTSVRSGYDVITDKHRPSLYSPVHYMKDAQFVKEIEEARKPETTINEADRNDLIFRGVAIVNKNYAQYLDSMTQTRADLLTVADCTALGLTTAATIATPVMSKTVLSGIATVILGSKATAEKNYYQEVSFFVLSARMRAERMKAYAKIVEKTKNKIDVYGLEEALGDLDEYFTAGTVMNSFAVNYEGAKDDAAKTQQEVETKKVIHESVKSEIATQATETQKSIQTKVQEEIKKVLGK